MSKLKLEDKINFITSTLDELYPEPDIPLNHENHFTFLIAVMLSAQSTDKKVNEITPRLFEKANSPSKMKELEVDEIQSIIRQIGLAPTKAKNIKKMFAKPNKNNIPIQIEIDTKKQLEECLKYNIDAVLLDNMEPQKIKECIQIIEKSEKKIFIEVSGGITFKKLGKYLIKGVDAISVGATIHQATFKNIKLEFLK